MFLHLKCDKGILSLACLFHNATECLSRSADSQTMEQICYADMSVLQEYMKYTNKHTPVKYQPRQYSFNPNTTQCLEQDDPLNKWWIV